ncbi:hypothetical protein TOPH_07664, partial [Tolypocladium ophioglossoides CBS 100239]
MKHKESKKQRSQQDLGQLDQPPPPYDFYKGTSLAQDLDSDADADTDADTDTDTDTDTHIVEPRQQSAALGCGSFAVRSLAYTWHIVKVTLLSTWQTEPFNLAMIFLPNPKVLTRKDLDWEARLEVHAKDVLRLMKQGFYCTEAN